MGIMAFSLFGQCSSDTWFWRRPDAAGDFRNQLRAVQHFDAERKEVPKTYLRSLCCLKEDLEFQSPKPEGRTGNIRLDPGARIGLGG